MSNPIIASNKPSHISLKKGEEYCFCSCGKSASQPFCDGSHEGTSFQPIKHTAETDDGYFCMCKHSARLPFCDGTHKQFLDNQIGSEGPGAEAAFNQRDKSKNAILTDQPKYNPFKTPFKNNSIELVPVCKTLLADTETPLSVYLKLANKRFGSYLYESVVGGEKWGRYSMVGLGCNSWLKVQGQTVECYYQNKLVETLTEQNPLDYIKEFQQQFSVQSDEKLPKYSGGLVGYFGYEMVKHVESKLASLAEKPDLLKTPDCILILSLDLAVVDNLSGLLYLITHIAKEHTPQELDDANKQLDNWTKILQHTTFKSHLRQSVLLDKEVITASDFQSEFGEQAYLEAVDKAKEYILDGDVMQVVPSQRFYTQFNYPAIDLYRAIRHINPSPYMYFIEYGDFQIVGASPEILVRQEDSQVIVRPIAGTRPRGGNFEEDQQLEQNLLSDEKEIAEHLMLIDLGRNDIGRIAKPGSIRLTDKMIVERYSHVMHIVSNVAGELSSDTHPIDVLKATFPAGTISGAPKVRAMEIIDELEPSKRGVYSGAVGYFGWDNNMDMAIAIRTAVVKDKMLYIQAGGGVVADSVAQNEWQESVNKAKAMFRAANFVTNGMR